MLEKYREKRDFEKTPEPDPFESSEAGGPLRFVIQKHDARREHYDVRLELDGVLLSWAVPKGPSLNPADKRLAVKVEDHPLSYATFEGQIPKGEYGGGEVIVWDEGVYSPDDKGELSFDDRDEAERRMREDLKKGKLSITFRGAKMSGSWTIVKTSKGEDWLMIKHRDAHATDKIDILADDRSVRSGLTTEDLRQGKKPVELGPGNTPGAKKAILPKGLLPMSPTEIKAPFSDPAWAFEVKVDGIRAIATFEQGKVRLISRNGNDITHKFPALVEELKATGHKSFAVDGEIVTYDEEGRPSFHGLMQRYHLTNPAEIRQWDQKAPVEFCVFDLLYFDGWDLRSANFADRRALLDKTSLKTSHIRILDSFPEEGKLLYEHAKEHGFEGVVGKRLDSRYHAGVRTKDWVKIKTYNSEDFLVVGYTKGEGARASTFGALILAEKDEKGNLRYVGNVGGGFNDRQLDELRPMLDSLRTEKKQVDAAIPAKQKPVWVDPKLWAEVRFMAWTPDRRLRFPIFMRLRPDHAETPVMAEVEEAPAAGASSPDEVASVLQQLKGKKDELKLSVEGHEIKFSSLNKVLWPATDDMPAVTKRDLAAYYAQVSPYMIPHLRDRPLSLVRFPSGIGSESFFQKHWEHKLPEFVDRVDIWSESNKESGEYMLCNNLATLLWFAQMGTLEIHPWYSRVNNQPDAKQFPRTFSESEAALDQSVLSYPDFLVVDLDPYIYSGKEKEGDEPELNDAAFRTTIEAAYKFKELADALKLKVFLKTSGKTGLHVYVPVKREIPFDLVKDMAQTFGQQLSEMMPGKITMEWSVKKRPGKIFFDHNQNVRGKTLVSIYSPRPSQVASVSFPVSWADLEKVYPTQYTIWTVPAILTEKGDPWKGILQEKQDLLKIFGRR